MPDRSFVIVAVIAFLAPFVRELLPPLGIPSIVFELVGGIIVGPQVLAIAETTPPVELFSQIGLAALLFLAGREIQVDQLRDVRLRRAVEQFGIGMLLAGAIAIALGATGLVEKPLLIAIVFAATSLSIIIVPLRETGAFYPCRCQGPCHQGDTSRREPAVAAGAWVSRPTPRMQNCRPSSGASQ